MTIVALWYRKVFDQLWCVSDSRISSGGTTITDGGHKILPIPVLCWRQDANNSFGVTSSNTFGFAFAGSTLAATNTHALVVSCTQNLVSSGAHPGGPVALKTIAELCRSIGEHYVIEMAGRINGPPEQISRYFFDAFIFGFCPILKRYQAFVIVSNNAGPAFRMVVAELEIAPNGFHLLGSGEQAFLAIHKEIEQSGNPTGVIYTLREMLKKQDAPGVGGYFQLGVAHQGGFNLLPILNLGSGPGNRTVTFLGWDVASFPDLSGYHIGYQAFSPDVD